MSLSPISCNRNLIHDLKVLFYLSANSLFSRWNRILWTIIWLPRSDGVESFRVAVNGTLNFAQALKSFARISNSCSRLSCSHDENAVNTLSAVLHLGHWLIIRCWMRLVLISKYLSVTNLIFNICILLHISFDIFVLLSNEVQNGTFIILRIR